MLWRLVRRSCVQDAPASAERSAEQVKGAQDRGDTDGAASQPPQGAQSPLLKVAVLRISAIVDACFRLIVDGKSVLPWRRWGKRTGTGLTVAQSSTISLKRPAVESVLSLGLIPF